MGRGEDEEEETVAVIALGGGDAWAEKDGCLLNLR